MLNCINDERNILIECEQKPSIEDTTDCDATEKDPILSTQQILPSPENHFDREKSIEAESAAAGHTIRLKKSKLRLKKSHYPYNKNVKSCLSSSTFSDEAAIYGQAWACGFRKLSPQQKLFAKKAIDEILILGQLKALKLRTIPININFLEDTSDQG